MASGADVQPPWHDVPDCLPVPVAVLDARGAVVAASTGFTRLLDATDPCNRLAQLVSSAPSDVAREIDLTSRRGVDLRGRVRPVAREGASPEWYVLQVQDPDAAAHDPPTALLTRDALVIRLRQALAHRTRHGGAVEVVVVDVDHVKRVNDTHGHVVGDEVLVEVARRLEAVSRPEDTVCRWGGEEFVLLLEDVQADGSEVVRRRVDEALRRLYLASHGLVLRLSASCGSVRATGHEDPVDVMHQADLLMYELKREHHAREGGGAELNVRLARAHARAQALHATLDDTMRRVRPSAAADRVATRPQTGPARDRTGSRPTRR
ncbi:MAG: hypothetical protein JWN08_591 [Frankiales bacterium]|nr:hypothetical protein [Frankiales bacterium]